MPNDVLSQWSAATDRAAFVVDQFAWPPLREALYLASPNLYERLLDHEQARRSAPSAEFTLQFGGKAFAASGLAANPTTDKLINALGRYLARAAFRCTPFGLFSTVSTGSIGADSDFSALASAPIRRHVNYDADVELKVVAQLVQDRLIRHKIDYRTNTSLAGFGSTYYFTEATHLPGRPSYLLSRLEKTEALARVVEAAAQGAPLAALSELVARECEVEPDEAQDYIEQLIDMQVLMPTLTIPVSGGARLLGVHATLERLGEGQRTRALAELLRAIRAQAVLRQDSALIAQYQQAGPLLEELGLTPEARSALFHVDCQRDFQPRLDEATVAEVIDAARALAEFCMEPVELFSEHKRLFGERFGSAEVPLELALHSELGVPFPAQSKAVSELLDGVRIGLDTGARTVKHNLARSQVLTDLFERALRGGHNAIHIAQADIDKVKLAGGTPPALSEGLYASALMLDGEQAPFLLRMVSGTSGAEMLGRFTSSDATLLAHVQQMLQRHERRDPGRIYAEIVHNGGGRLNNVVSRPVLRGYEIVFLGDTEIDTARQIPVADLTVRLDNGQYRLRSRRLGKEIVPRMATAHNFGAHTLGMYNFLCSLQLQERPELGNFRWPAAFASVRRLPRVCYRNAIWSAATWRFDTTDAEALRRSAASADGLSAWRALHALPRFVTIDVGDNALPIDLANPALVAILLEEIDNMPHWMLSEALSLNGAGAAGYSREVVIPFLVGDDAALAVPAGPAAPAVVHQPAQFAPGSAWSYFKLYCGELLADALLVETVAPLLRQAQQDKAIDRWFFVRYADPDKHVRVRFHSDSPEQARRVSDALSQALQPALADFRCKKIMLDTYEQELARYGGAQAIELVEQLFCIDSVEVSEVIGLLGELEAPPARWLVAMMGIEAWLAAFSLTAPEQLDVMSAIAEGFKREFAIRPVQKVQMGAKFRGYRGQIDAHFFATSMPPDSQALQDCILRFGPAKRAVVERLRALERAGQLSLPLIDILPSLIHMYCNRLLELDHRRHELVLYDFMTRVLQSQQSRGKRSAAGELAATA